MGNPRCLKSDMPCSLFFAVVATFTCSPNKSFMLSKLTSGNIFYHRLISFSTNTTKGALLLKHYIGEAGKKHCNIYKGRPLNCRLFPYWILSDAPQKEIKKLASPDQKCLEEFEIDADFVEDRKIYHRYKEKIVKILMEEVRISDEFYKKLGLKKIIKTKMTRTKQKEREMIAKLVAKIGKTDYTALFKKVDKEIKKHNFIGWKILPKIEDSVL